MKAFRGTWSLVKLALRRDRMRLVVWIFALVGMTVLVAASFPELYDSAQERQARAALMANPSAKGFAGPGHGLEDYTFGAMMTNEMMGFVAIFVALMSVLLIVRHTRAEEELGSTELVRASAAGRLAGLTAAFLVVGGVNIVVGGLVAIGIGMLNIESMNWASSWLFGASLASVGLVFMAIAAVTAQLSEHARTASGLAGAAIAVAYTLRAAGDMGDGALSWASPFGWAHATMVYVNDRWWPLLLAVAAVIVFVGIALWLNVRRDVGGGMLPARLGRAGARRGLLSANGLAARLQRSGFVWWLVGLTAFGLLYGTLLGEVEAFIEGAGFAESFFTTSQSATLVDSFLAVIVMMLALVGSIFTISSVMRLRHEEISGRLEPLLATATSRTHLAMSHVWISLLGSAALLLCATLGLAMSAVIVMDDISFIPRLIVAALAYIPAMWCVAGLALTLFGVWPRAIVVAWAMLIYGMIVGVLGGLLGLPEWLYDLSVFAHVPLLPAEEFTVMPLLVLLTVSVVLIVIGLMAFRRRDILG